MDQRELAHRLADVTLFRGLSDKERRQVVEAARVVEHAPGHEVIREGRGGVGFHLILDGEASIIRGEKQVQRIGPGDYFGEISLLDGKPRSATVRAETPLRTLSILAWEFQPLLESQPALTRNMLKGLCAYVRESFAREAM